MSNSNNGNGRGNGNGGGPPDHANGRGPPDHVRQRRAERDYQGRVSVGDDPAAEAAEAVDWGGLSPFQRWVVALLDEEGLI